MSTYRDKQIKAHVNEVWEKEIKGYLATHNKAVSDLTDWDIECIGIEAEDRLHSAYWFDIDNPRPYAERTTPNGLKIKYYDKFRLCADFLEYCHCHDAWSYRLKERVLNALLVGLNSRYL